MQTKQQLGDLGIYWSFVLLVPKLDLFFFQKTDEPDTPKTKVMYEGRDILDLGANLRGPDFCQPSQLLPLNTIDNKYFDNRSPCSRLMNAFPPRHINITCNFEKCDFVMQCYFDWKTNDENSFLLFDVSVDAEARIYLSIKYKNC